MKTIRLYDLLIRFFSEHLRQQRNVSQHTILAYRDTFRLLLRFLKRTYHLPPATVDLSAVTPERVLAFLAHLEQNQNKSGRSRNARLAAIRSFSLTFATGGGNPRKRLQIKAGFSEVCTTVSSSTHAQFVVGGNLWRRLGRQWQFQLRQQ